MNISEKRARKAASVRAWRARNPERARELRRKSYRKHASRNREIARQWRKDPENARAAYEHKKRSLRDPLKRAAHVRRNLMRDLRKAYGITIGQLESLYARQRGKCAICLLAAPMRGDDCLEVDHDHASGRVRGLLCGPCNRALGSVRDDIATLREMITYLLACGVEERR